MICRAIPYEGREPYIFFSYSHKDSERVYPLLEQMVRDGYRVWYDDGNHPGDDWLENIGQHLNNCHICLAMMSQNSEESHNCKKEVSFAVQCGKILMAIKLEDFAMTVGMRLQLSTIHYLVRTDFPSDKVLLEKLYETDSMQTCRGIPGSIPMRTVTEEIPRENNTLGSNGVLQSFVNNNISCQSEENVAQTPVDEAVQPVKNTPKLKTSKVITKVKLVKKLSKPVVKAEPAPAAPVQEDDSAEAPVEAPVHSEEPEMQETPAMPKETQADAPEVKAPADVAAPIAEPAVKETVSAEEPQGEETSVVKGPPIVEQAGTLAQKATPSGKILLLRLADGSCYISDKEVVRVGRSDIRCDLVLKNNHLISNYHLNIICENGSCYLQDAGSSNGTYLNGERLLANNKVLVCNAARFQICNEEFMLFYGTDLADSLERRMIAYLRNPATESVRVLSGEAFPLDRMHKWEDGSLSNGNISRVHARIVWDAEGYYLEDLGSKNGTYCNEQRLASKSRCRLTSGDKIRLVDTVLEMNIVTF